MSHPRIEEVSDSDLSDPSEADIEDFTESDILRQVFKPAAPPAQSREANAPRPTQLCRQTTAEEVKSYHCLYPIYFDAGRTRSGGRRVPANLAVKNPLAREVANACATLLIQPILEPDKIHPKDWANPGRVRVNLKDKADPNIRRINNKHHLYILVAKYLRQHPTTEQSASLRQLQFPGLNMPGPDEPWPKPAVPTGWKMGELLPAHSAAMTGGGVSENALLDMMSSMGGAGPGGAGGASGMPDMMNMLQSMGGMGGLGSSGGPASSDQVQGGGKRGKKGKR